MRSQVKFMILYCVSAFFLVFVTTFDAVRSETWIELGPAPITTGPYTGRCSAVVASQTDPNVYYVAGASGGVWKTVNGGATWVPLTDHLPINAIGALAMDPDNEDIIYAGSGEANFANHSFYGMGLYKTTNGGTSWQVLAEDTFAGRTFSRIVISMSNSNVLFASIMEAGGFPALNAAKGHPRKDDPVGVYRSTDGGLSWILLTNGIPATAASDIWMDPNNSTILYAAIGNIFGKPENGIYKTIDDGDSWTKLTDSSFPQNNNGRISLAIAPSNSNRIYAMITYPASSTGGGASMKGIYKSDNAGTTWSDISSYNIQSTYGWYLSTMIVDPLNPDIVFAGGLSLVRSLTGGSQWSGVTPQHVDMHGLAYDAAHNLLCANDGGLHRSTTNGSSWISLNNNLGVVQFYAGLSSHPSNATFVLAGFQDNGTNRREGSVTWAEVFGGDGGYTALHPDTPETVFAEYQGTASLYRSTNGGDSFSYAGSGISSADRNCFLPPYTYSPDDENILLYATHRIYRSTNNGSNWTAISADLTGGSPGAIRALVIAPSNSLTVYTATNDGRILVSQDGGYQWSLKLTDIPGGPRVTREIAIDPLDDSIAFLAVSQFGVNQIMKTTNYGDTWAALDGDLPDIPVNTVAVYQKNGFRVVFLGTDKGVYVSDENGLNWMLYGTGMPHSPIVDLVVDTNFNRLLAATMGRGLWAIVLPQVPMTIPSVSHWGLGCIIVLIVIISWKSLRKKRDRSDCPLIMKT